MTIKLYDIAHSRAGDKGNTLTLSLIPYQAADYPLLCTQVTAEAVKQHLTEIVAGEITRYELPNLPALQFVCQQALTGGVTTSLTMDTHGKKFELRPIGNADTGLIIAEGKDRKVNTKRFFLIVIGS